MLTACPLKNWEDSLLPSSSRRPFAGARLVKGFNHLVAAVLEQDPAVQGAGESCSWRARMTVLQRRLVSLRKISVSRRSNLRAFGGGLLVQARGNSWGQLIFKDLVKFDG